MDKVTSVALVVVRVLLITGAIAAGVTTGLVIYDRKFANKQQ